MKENGASYNINKDTSRTALFKAGYAFREFTVNTLESNFLVTAAANVVTRRSLKSSRDEAGYSGVEIHFKVHTRNIFSIGNVLKNCFASSDFTLQVHEALKPPFFFFFFFLKCVH